MKPQISISFQNGQLVVTLTCSSSWPTPPLLAHRCALRAEYRTGQERSVTLAPNAAVSSSLLSCAIFLN